MEAPENSRPRGSRQLTIDFREGKNLEAPQQKRRGRRRNRHFPVAAVDEAAADMDR